MRPNPFSVYDPGAVSGSSPQATRVVLSDWLGPASTWIEYPDSRRSGIGTSSTESEIPFLMGLSAYATWPGSEQVPFIRRALVADCSPLSNPSTTMRVCRSFLYLSSARAPASLAASCALRSIAISPGCEVVSASTPLPPHADAKTTQQRANDAHTA